MVNVLYVVIILLTCPWITFSAAQEDFGNFVDIEAYQDMPSHPCCQNANQAREFLQKGRKKCDILALFAVQQNEPEILRKASIDLFLLSQVAAQRNIIQVGVPVHKRSCCQKVAMWCEQTVSGLENFMIHSYSPVIAMQVAKNKADRTDLFLQMSSILSEKKEN
jgi:Tat protein secretion system quality control protein TatD with DNase activity